MSIELSDKQRALLQEHLNMVLEANCTLNLTRIESEEQAQVLHIEDSLSALDEIETAPRGLYIDIGSGAGYPGIPIAVATGRKTTLLEARKNKAAFLDNAIKRLGLQGYVEALHMRAEELAAKKKASYAVATARAVSQLSVLMELASPLLKEGGVLVCYKGDPSQEELDNARKVQKDVGMYLISDRSFAVGEDGIRRRILCFERRGKSGVALPRHVGFAQKKPL